MKKSSNVRVWQSVVLMVSLSSVSVCFSAEKTVDVYRVHAAAENKGIGEKIGTITFKESKNGLLVSPHLKGLPAGDHGFHIHENPSCDSAEKDGKWVAAQAAGGHLDPQHTTHHEGPQGKGHLGDLPKLVVDKKGETPHTVTAPRLTLANIEGHSIIIHEHGDNYSDQPEALGGGGARIACGVIAK
ncbi:superoxide dismutase family protein [Candidatus Berkiella aquae]|uniref:Superoxide dismutase [Cu-Zn] n=1 Tax=Candidatus Berkiella aquae TaxID=295108 RepID=A0A0Q9YUI7_9GAMM|nr:superoxide dismutase family protein [Candidatus Berkiella aquae]MCS5710204.1 superoxide dismutase family protein [Candidatus Berkiella aquae]